MKPMRTLLLATLLVAGCSSVSTSVDNMQPSTTVYQGRTLYCMSDNVGTSTGIASCDFVRFYAENPDLLPTPTPTPRPTPDPAP